VGRSIIKQSYDARERIMDASLPSHLAHGNLNGDGFGIGEPLHPAPSSMDKVSVTVMTQAQAHVDTQVLAQGLLTG
jgi:hypothetical protein